MTLKARKPTVVIGLHHSVEHNRAALMQRDLVAAFPHINWVLVGGVTHIETLPAWAGDETGPDEQP